MIFAVPVPVLNSDALPVCFQTALGFLPKAEPSFTSLCADMWVRVAFASGLFHEASEKGGEVKRTPSLLEPSRIYFSSERPTSSELEKNGFWSPTLAGFGGSLPV